MLPEIYTKEFVSDPELLPEIESYVMRTIKDVEIPPEKINDLTLAVAETAANSIEHGNKFDISKKVLVTIRIDKDKVTLIFKDEGKGFKPDEVPDPTAPENILKDHGRGIHIMRSFLDDVKFNFTPYGTEVILTVHYG